MSTTPSLRAPALRRTALAAATLLLLPLASLAATGPAAVSPAAVSSAAVSSAAVSPAAVSPAAQEPEPGPGARPGVFDPSESLLVSTLILDEDQPEARALRHIQVMFAEALGAPRGFQRTREEALALAERLRADLAAGRADFGELARKHSSARSAIRGGVMGSFPRGILHPSMDAFLFDAEVGDLSEPLLLPTGFHLVQRIERWAAARGILIAGRDDAARARLAAVRERLAAGEDFAAVAREVSDDPVSAPNGGALGIFERGPTDRLLKAAAFDLEVGAVSAPIESPLGLHLVKRVPEDELDEGLRDSNWARVRAIVLTQRETPLEIPTSDRSASETLALADALAARIEAGEDFAALAREYNDDFADGRGRAGDLGWIFRRQPGVSPALAPIFNAAPGDVVGPTPTNFGWLLLKRER